MRRYRPQVRKALARGSAQKSGRLSLVTHYEPELFQELRAFAARERVSAGEAVRTLVTWGLESAGDRG